jgi:glycosyltransferase involved in cell wall biosynthesis
MIPQQNVSILIPAYNEQATILKVLRKLVQLEIALHEIIIVDDGSTDGTAEKVENWLAGNTELSLAGNTELSLAGNTELSLAGSPKIRLIRQPRNLGKTAAIAKAIDESTGDILIIQDADLEYDPIEIPGVIEPILIDVADVVYGSRFLVKKASRVLYFYHYLANKFLTLLSNLLTNRNMSDIETCYKAFRREVIHPLNLTSRGFGMEVEITAMICKTNARTYEVPISYYGRTYEEGKKIGITDGIAAIWYILYYNLIVPLTTQGQAYIRKVNASLEERRAARMSKDLQSE